TGSISASSRDAAKTATRAMEASTRAWLTIDTIIDGNKFQLAPDVLVGVKVTNSGKTPAMMIYSTSAVGFAQPGSAASTNPPYVNPYGGLGIIGPGQSQTLYMPIKNLSPDKIADALADPPRRLFRIYTHVQYWDEFMTERGLVFCMEWDRAGKTFDACNGY